MVEYKVTSITKANPYTGKAYKETFEDKKTWKGLSKKDFYYNQSKKKSRMNVNPKSIQSATRRLF